ncbi:MAG: hypothetical protein H6588_08265 [Flavobacteriales bacterium]|nr:hypothetical protein [Flavobacteriales bacterium]
MPNQLTYQVFELIKSLSKAEKRHFKIYAKRNQAIKSIFFVELFDILDKMPNYDEQKINQKLPELKGNSLSNHKAHLYEQVLISLRLLHHKEIDVRIKELISFADILHKKGLYKQSLLQLEKAKLLAEKNNNNVLKLEIVENEKLIESRYITRSDKNRATSLVEESRKISQTLQNESEWSNLALQLYDYYLKFGHVKNESENKIIKNFFTDNLPKTNVDSFYSKLYKHQSYAWYNYITQNFATCYKHSKEWINLFDDEKQKSEPELYMKGLHNCLSSLFYCDNKERFSQIQNILDVYIRNHFNTFNKNQIVLAFIYQETSNLNLFFLEGKFSEGSIYGNELIQKIENIKIQLDVHRIFMFYYKIACLRFGSKDYKGAIKLLNYIINHPNNHLREDIQCFSRILNLIAHYELGNDELIEHQIKSTYRFLLK